MTRIQLREISRHLASRTRARELRQSVVEDIESNRLKATVDLTDVLSISDSFADEFFGVLAVTYGDVWFREHIEVVGATDVVRGSIVRAIGSRLERSANGSGKPQATGYSLAPPPETLSP